MKLYIYEHCPFCTRARMIVGLKSLPVMLQVIMEGDAETPLRLIGKKAVPILQKEDGSHMGESLDIVRYLDGIGPTVLMAPQDPTLDAWVKEAWPTALKLFIPRFVQADFAEINTPVSKRGVPAARGTSLRRSGGFAWSHIQAGGGTAASYQRACPTGEGQKNNRHQRGDALARIALAFHRSSC